MRKIMSYEDSTPRQLGTCDHTNATVPHLCTINPTTDALLRAVPRKIQFNQYIFMIISALIGCKTFEYIEQQPLLTHDTLSCN